MKRLYYFEEDPKDSDSDKSSSSSNEDSINRVDPEQAPKKPIERRRSFTANLIDQFMRILGQKTHQ